MRVQIICKLYVVPLIVVQMDSKFLLSLDLSLYGALPISRKGWKEDYFILPDLKSRDRPVLVEGQFII